MASVSSVAPITFGSVIADVEDKGFDRHVFQFEVLSGGDAAAGEFDVVASGLAVKRIISSNRVGSERIGSFLPVTVKDFCALSS